MTVLRTDGADHESSHAVSRVQALCISCVEVPTPLEKAALFDGRFSVMLLK
jgi:hypothetical protein